MHEGCNARAFVCLKVSADALTLGPEELERLSFLTVKPISRSVKGRTSSSLPSSRTENEVFLPLCPPRTLDLSASDIYDWSTIIDLVRTMLPSAVPEAPAET